MENTDAESVDDITAAISKDSVSVRAEKIGYETGNPINKETGNGCCQCHPEGGEYDLLAQYRFDFCVFGIHTTRKQDDTQSNHTDELRP